MMRCSALTSGQRELDLTSTNKGCMCANWLRHCSSGIGGQGYKTGNLVLQVYSHACLQKAVHACGGQVEVGQVRRAWRQATRPAALARAAKRVLREIELTQTGQALEAAQRGDAVVRQPEHL